MATVSLEKFASINAELDARKRPREEVLQAAGVTDEAWAASQDFWLGRMAQEAKRNKFALSQRYAALFAERRAALEKKKAPKKPPPRLASERQQIVAPIPIAAPLSAPQNGGPAAVPFVAAPPPSAVQVIGQGPPSVPRAPFSQPAPPPPSIRQPPASIPPASMPPPSQAYVARLSVDQLAAMRAELAVSPEAEHATVRLRFGLDDATWVLEEAHWQKRFAQDKSLFDTYVKRFQYFRALMAPRT